MAEIRDLGEGGRTGPRPGGEGLARPFVCVLVRVRVLVRLRMGVSGGISPRS